MSTKNKQQLQNELEELQKEKAKLMQIKAATPSKFTKKQQERLDEVAELAIDLEEQIDLADDETAENKTENKADETITNSGYNLEPGTENLVHLSIVKGRRFDENTGKELSTPYVQKFTYSEYLNFMKNATLIGYTIIEELYNPYKK